MTTFGFSTYLKLICSTPKVQNTTVRNRVFPKMDGGYDFHRSLRLLAQRRCSGHEEISVLLSEAEKIVREPESKSAKEGLIALEKWLLKNKGQTVSVNSIRISSPSSSFFVSYAPDFGIQSDGGVIAVHLWNTKKPALDRRFVVGALSAVSGAYEAALGYPLEAAVLSLRDGSFYTSKDADIATKKLGTSMLAAIDSIFEKIKGGEEKGKAPAISPFAPPPP